MANPTLEEISAMLEKALSGYIGQTVDAQALCGYLQRYVRDVIAGPGFRLLGELKFTTVDRDTVVPADAYTALVLAVGQIAPDRARHIHPSLTSVFVENVGRFEVWPGDPSTVHFQPITPLDSIELRFTVDKDGSIENRRDIR